MENSIQTARDILAKWRKAATQGDWHLGDSDPAPGWEHHRAVDVGPGGAITDYIDPGDARLIVGTAGNPALLDALEMLLNTAIIETRKNMHVDHAAERIAAAMIAADEAMS